jgi:hypothetical protein
VQLDVVTDLKTYSVFSFCTEIRYWNNKVKNKQLSAKAAEGPTLQKLQPSIGRDRGS